MEDRIIPIDLTLIETRKERNKQLNTLRNFYTSDVNTSKLLFRSPIDLSNSTASLIFTESKGSAIHKIFNIDKTPFTYTVPKDVIIRSGSWVCQINIERDGKVLTNKEFTFDVFGSLLDGFEPTLVDIDNYTLLFNQITSLKNDSKLFLDSLNIGENQRIKNENTRNEVHETIVDEESRRHLNERERMQNESSREFSELSREQRFTNLVDEGLIKSNLESIINKKMSEITQSNDTITTQLKNLNREMIDYLNSVELSEEQRVEVEHIRNSLFDEFEADEEIRKQNELQRIASYERIEDFENEYNVSATNLIKNGDFSKDVESWEKRGSGDISIVDGRLRNTTTTSPVNFGTGTKATFKKDNVYYLSVGHYRINMLGKSPTTISVRKTDALTSELVYNVHLYNDVADIQKMTTTFTVPNEGGSLLFLTYLSEGGYQEIDNVLLLDLTETFGKGNEPTKAQMDRLLTQFPNSWFDGTKNLFQARWALNELRRLDSEKANVNQEVWITPTLLNGWTIRTTVEYFKDSMGFVHLRGSVQTGVNGSIVLTLPTGYRVSKQTELLVKSSGVNVGSLSILPNGTLTINAYTTWASLDGVQFLAER